LSIPLRREGLCFVDKYAGNNPFFRVVAVALRRDSGLPTLFPAKNIALTGRLIIRACSPETCLASNNQPKHDLFHDNIIISEINHNINQS
jgi:hypothetical protein